MRRTSIGLDLGISMLFAVVLNFFVLRMLRQTYRLGKLLAIRVLLHRLRTRTPRVQPVLLFLELALMLVNVDHIRIKNQVEGVILPRLYLITQRCSVLIITLINLILLRFL